MLTMLFVACFLRTAVVIVHMEPTWEGSERVAPEVNRLAAFTTVYNLISEEGARSYVTHGEKVVSPGGAHSLNPQTPVVVLCGGYFGACFANALGSLVESSPDLQTIIIPMRAVYDGRKRSLWETYLRDPESLQLHIRPVIKRQLREDFRVAVNRDLLFVNMNRSTKRVTRPTD